MKLTDGTISRLKPTKADAVYYDDDLPGFGHSHPRGRLTQLGGAVSSRRT